ncbi:MAG: ABC transporter ATP-binding protein [Pirellula sp.]|jgi:ABC-2 type transport system ATP-binding protein|nr:ABC transporter ATP-binding protein [Pirellula sp.]
MSFYEKPADKVFEIESVRKSYGSKQVLKNISLSIPTGVVGLLGPNGSGKSTLIKTILGLVSIDPRRGDTGSGQVLGFDWPSQVRIVRDHVGYLPEDDCYLQGLQGIESIQMMARLSGLMKKEALRRSHEVADYCDLGQERYRNVETYSTGMRQKLKFAQALVHDPRWIILDEPTTGLDPQQREQFLDRIYALANEQGKSILLSTHILHDVIQTCDHVVIMAAGQIRLVDTLDNLQRPSQEGLQISVVSNAGKLGDALRAQGIQSNSTSDSQLVVLGDESILLDCIWKTSIEQQVTVLRIEQAKNSLEQAFLDAVRS